MFSTQLYVAVAYNHNTQFKIKLKSNRRCLQPQYSLEDLLMVGSSRVFEFLSYIKLKFISLFSITYSAISKEREVFKHNHSPYLLSEKFLPL
ncbi:unnamed protein product [Lactuca virosa]|uniref:Uncharacterized protein n=1 Tax=Lactuca virosa TaxID=75947 RepID=A0AAU9MIZ7_9ASTR|nr:unnamed protein product [Lactuca virosa]